MASGPQGDDDAPEDPFGDDDSPNEEPFGDAPEDPLGSSSPFPGLSFNFDLSGIDLGALARALHSSGPVNWEVASQLAGVVATGGEDEPSVDPGDRSELEELARAAETHVVAETGLTASFTAPARALNRREWATLHLDALRPVLERLATTLGAAFQPETLFGEQPEAAVDPLAGVLPILAPLLLGVQAGSMVGYLAQHALGRYDLPLPAADDPSLCFVVRNVDEFETDWSLERADLRFYLAIHEVVHAAERSVPWVRARMVDLATEYVSGYVVDPTILQARLGDIDPNDPSSLEKLANKPDELLGAMRSPQQLEVLERVRVLHSTIDGYADTILERIGNRLIPSFGRIHEAMARHRLERGEADLFVGGLLGLANGREDYERGAAFCAGVVERAGSDGLNRLWERPEMLPTPNELDAPGLWLARIELDLE